MTVTNIADRWVSIDVVGEMTGFAHPTLYRMAREGRIPAHRVGRSIKFKVTEVQAWMDKAPKASS